MTKVITKNGAPKVLKKGVSCPKESDPAGHSLDKLAQLVTKEKNYQEQGFDFNLVSGVDASNKKALKKRARRKYMTNAYNWALVKASKDTEKSILLKSYLNTYYCAKELTLRSDGKVTGHYCKNRWCLVCNRNKKTEVGGLRFSKLFA